ncbi:FG-GAP-like repeat-containing protein [Puniceicoccaceae bacterium K14]|nr:FG-GAP-like repeat-containing protein [Puniceicoccaceae bacterium K14]
MRGIQPLTLTIATLSFFSITELQAQLLDRDGDGVSDLWQGLYKLPTINPDQDSDGDGTPDADEAIAGTDPFSATSQFTVTDFEILLIDPTSLHTQVTFDAIAGKSYRLQESTLAAKENWTDIGFPFLPQISGPTEFEAKLSLPLDQHFQRILVADIDEDEDGLSAADELTIGTSDKDPNTGGGEGRTDLDAALDWLSDKTPGTAPTGTADNLSEVDVAWIRQPFGTTTPALLATAVGTGGWHQLSTWSVSEAGVPVEITTSSPIEGFDPQLVTLPIEGNPASSPHRFVSGRLRVDGNLWLSSRSANDAGTLRHHRSVGFGSNAGVDATAYCLTQRPLRAMGETVAHQVVTPLIYLPTGKIVPSLRVISWRVEAASGELSALGDSGELSGLGLPTDAATARLGIAHLSGDQFQLTYRNASGNQAHYSFFLSSSGTFTSGGVNSDFADIRGSGLETLPQQANAIGGLASNGYFTATRDTEGDLSMQVWDLQADDDGDHALSLLSDDSVDLLPQTNGIFLPNPGLSNGFDENARAGEQVGEALAVGDFNGDGFPDLAIGAPGYDLSDTDNTGAVFILHGDSHGLTGRGYEQVWTQASDGVPLSSEAGDRFGTSLAAGDFNGDGNDDLAIGLPYEEVSGVTAAGAVLVLYGTPFGLTSDNARNFTQTFGGLSSESFDYFGWALTAGDYNNDGHDDLAIGILNETVGNVDNAGAVMVLHGSSSRLQTGNRQYIHQDQPNTWNSAEVGDGFGRALATGDFDNDSFDDLAVGISREMVSSQPGAGAVHVFYGSSDSLDQDIFVSQAGFSGGEDIRGATETNDYFGESLAAGDFNGDGTDDLAIGVPGEDIGTVADGGAVNVLYGIGLFNFGLSDFNNLLITQETFNPVGGSLGEVASAGDRFGHALATGDFNGDSLADLVVGTPFKEQLNDASNTGLVYTILGSNDGLTDSGSRKVTFNRSRTDSEGNSYALEGDREPNDQFGSTLITGDFGADGQDDLIVGIPDKDYAEDTLGSGAIQIIPGSASDLFNYGEDEQWFVRLPEPSRARVSDLAREGALGPGWGKLYGKDEHLEERHAASVTKCMTLLLTVEALENGHTALTRMVGVSELAGTTKGSRLLTYNAFGSEIKDDNGDPIYFIQPGDIMPLRLLIAAMMNESCNRSSTAIAQHIAEVVTGDPDRFIIMMNDKAAELEMHDTVFGHPAGGMVTRPQDLITLLLEGSKHPQFVEFGGIERYGEEPPHDALCGTWNTGDPKCNGPFSKFNTIGNYPGRQMWKGGNTGFWWSGDEALDVPTRPSGIPYSTASAVGISERAGREVAIAILQTNNTNRTEDSQKLFDYGFRKLFTPDLRGSTEYPESGGIVGSEDQVRVKNFALDRITAESAVTVIIDDFENIQVDIWALDSADRSISQRGRATRTYNLQDGTRAATPTVIALATLPTTAAIRDVLTANLDGSHLNLDLWRIGEEP